MKGNSKCALTLDYFTPEEADHSAHVMIVDQAPTALLVFWKSVALRRRRFCKEIIITCLISEVVKWTT